MPDSSTPPSFSTSRKFSAGLNVLVSAVALLALVVMVNFIAARHYGRYFLPADTGNQLSSSTHLVLKSLTNEVRIVVFFDREEPLYGDVAAILKEYSLASPKLNLDFVDYRNQPAKAGRIKAEYHLSDESKDLVIFSANNKVKVVGEAELSEYDFSKLLAGKGNEVKRKSFLGERLFTSAILTVSDPTPARVYFLTGHGEQDSKSSTTQRDCGKFATLLKDASMLVGELSLGGTNDIPADCQLLVLAGPVAKLETAEQEKIEKYLNQGGRMLFLISRRSEAGMENLLARWGVDVGDNLVVDRANTMEDSVLVVGNYASHPVVKSLAQAQLPIYLVWPRSVGRRANGAQSADAPQVTELAATGEKGIAVSDYVNGIKPNLVRDRQGVIPLMVAVEKGGIKEVNVNRGLTRMVVVGDSEFLNNKLLVANREFALSSVNWLLDRSHLLGGIGPRDIKDYTLVIPDDKMIRLRWVLLAGVPGVVLALGSMVWLRRRH